MHRNTLLRSVLILLAIVVGASSFILIHERPNAKHLTFRSGTIDHLAISEVLKITMHFPQVDNDEVRPSIRITDYDFTETVEKVNKDGSAMFAVTLDSFKTRIILGEGRDKEEYFAFNSNNDEDMKTKLHDIRTLPRAQFLGQTLRFTVGTDGQVKHFENLAQFHQNSLGPDADYDFVHAMLSISDSLRMQQLFEHGFGALAASATKEGEFSGPSTTTEIPITRTITLDKSIPEKSGADSLVIRGSYSNAPAHIDYLEGLSANLGLSEYRGSGRGYAVVENGMVVRAAFRDTSAMKLQVDIETVPEEIVRYITAYRSPVALMHGVIHLDEKRTHRGIPKAPKLDIDSNATEIIPGR